MLLIALKWPVMFSALKKLINETYCTKIPCYAFCTKNTC